ncbi:hypothetical protein [Coralloluteibacterium stylophorae]|uniref:Protocatechuate dioxygenase n=1 Tax=Coralloluteibacterium stylophorae TaxID=1776034 RepID=A0A8J8AYF4_9GAMM|nr:hypothetical protein [Coralloluteibacterium stylophorae]MBS7456929.1 hypothetical protein [Coralloluteibacterium stylophorae]
MSFDDRPPAAGPAPSRRRMLASLGTLAGGLLLPWRTRAADACSADAGSGACVLIPAETPGPFPLAEALQDPGIVRSDITDGQEGVPLELVLRLVDVDADCAPIQGAAIYVWHCDREGVYSGYAAAPPMAAPAAGGRDGRPPGPPPGGRGGGPGGPPGMGGGGPGPGGRGAPPPGGSEGGPPAMSQARGTAGETFLRGVQATDCDGEVRFRTIFPGWYAGRISHIHFQVFLDRLGRVSATSQIALPQAVTQAVYDSPLYRARGQNTSVADFAQDNVFHDGVEHQLAAVGGDVDSGYVARLVVGVAR